MRLVATVCFYLILLIGHSNLEGQTVAQTQAGRAKIESATLGTANNVHRAGKLYFAGQFSPTDVEIIKQEKFKRVITLRTNGEIDWDEKSAIEEAGIEFSIVSFQSPQALNDQVFDKIRKLLKDSDTKTLLHCGSANRVGGAWLPFRVLDEKVDVDTATKEAKEIGLRSEAIKRKALDYIIRHQSQKRK
ncbi:MAG: hypothetical protein AAGA30_17255 [Planctomycetota bacterium]